VRTKGRSRRVVSVESKPSAKPGVTNWVHTLTLDCGHTVIRRYPKGARFHFSECPVPRCGLPVKSAGEEEEVVEMANVKVGFVFSTELTQKEFSVVTRALAGHELKADDLVLARGLNLRLLALRKAQVAEYLQQAQRAYTVALEETDSLLKEQNLSEAVLEPTIQSETEMYRAREG
jgi:hypothetical protein